MAAHSLPTSVSPFTFEPEKTALIAIDTQNDFCTEGGYGALIGCDIGAARAIIPAIRRALDASRQAGLTIIHTRYGYLPDLSDCPASVRAHSGSMGAGVGDMGPLGRISIRGELGHALIEELQPLPGEIVLDKSTKGAFQSTDLESILRERGITHVVLTGVTTDVCVHSTLREAHDRGFCCLLLEDACAAYERWHHEAIVDITRMQGGIFGWVSTSREFAACLTAAAAPSPA
jgi:biuret amidohydrolase